MGKDPTRISSDPCEQHRRVGKDPDSPPSQRPSIRRFTHDSPIQRLPNIHDPDGDLELILQTTGSVICYRPPWKAEKQILPHDPLPLRYSSISPNECIPLVDFKLYFPC